MLNLYCYGNKKQCQLNKMEDAIYVGNINDYFVFMVADGNGGQVGAINIGQLSINIMLNYLKKVIQSHTSIQDIQKSLDVGFYLVSQSLLSVNAIDTKYENIYCSLSVLIVSKSSYQTVYGSIGNTEIQMVRNGKFNRINRVHSETYDALMNQEIEEKDYYIDPRRAILTSALGVFPEAKVDILYMGTLHEDDIILMTTDGIYRYITPDKVIEILASASSIEEGVNNVLNKVDEEGGEDNASLIVIHLYNIVAR